MPKNRKKNGIGKTIGCIVLALAGLVLLITALLKGNNVALFHAKGMIAHEQLGLMVITVGIMLVIAIPVLFLLYFTAWKYRESNKKAAYNPNLRHGKMLDLNMWLIPFAFMIVLAMIMWPATHRLEPIKPIAADKEPLTIQVVSMRWKWLFIYPEHNIATVNFVQIPVDTPVEFELTADESPMSSFWIPNLGGMLYAMTGHVNQLNLIADTPGDYPGSSGEINGSGFAGMKFTARASSEADFKAWVQEVRQSPKVLDATEYNKLLNPTEYHPPTLYAAADSYLYDNMLKKYMGNNGEHGHH